MAPSALPSVVAPVGRGGRALPSSGEGRTPSGRCSGGNCGRLGRGGGFSRLLHQRDFALDLGAEGCERAALGEPQEIFGEVREGGGGERRLVHGSRRREACRASAEGKLRFL